MDSLILLAKTVGGGWRPGIGDPSAVGWATVVAYLMAALACWRAFGRERRAAAAGRARGGAVTWLVLAGLMLLLGVNKQLDLQTAITAVARWLAREQGWYDARRTYQAAFIGVVAVAGLIGLLILGWMARRDVRRRFPALLGAVFLVAFVVIRASSFHRVDRMLGRDLGGLRWNWLLELGGIACVGLAAVVGSLAHRTRSG